MQTTTGDPCCPPEPGRTPRVLIVDDAVTVRMYHRRLVEAAGCTAEEAANGIEALERALGEPFDLFLVDVNMPQMDGYRFIAEVRRTPELQAVPAIMISTEAGAGDQDQAFAAGANFYLVKPVRPGALETFVRLLAGGAGR